LQRRARAARERDTASAVRQCTLSGHNMERGTTTPSISLIGQVQFNKLGACAIPPPPPTERHCKKRRPDGRCVPPIWVLTVDLYGKRGGVLLLLLYRPAGDSIQGIVHQVGGAQLVDQRNVSGASIRPKDMSWIFHCVVCVESVPREPGRCIPLRAVHPPSKPA
jgi:hypothetical protein